MTKDDAWKTFRDGLKYGWNKAFRIMLALYFPFSLALIFFGGKLLIQSGFLNQNIIYMVLSR